MLAITIEDQKLFNRELFAGSAFDHLRCCKAVIHHNVNCIIEGQYNLDYFSGEERKAKAKQIYASWKEIKPIAFQVIKGNHLPLEFQIVLSASPDTIEKLTERSSFALNPEQISGLYLNIHYKEETLTVTSGSSYHVFTLDKSLEQLWEQSIKTQIARLNIAYH